MEEFEELLESKIVEYLKNPSNGCNFKFSGKTFNITDYNNINVKLKELGSQKRVITNIEKEGDILYGKTQEAIAPDGKEYTEFTKLILASDGFLVKTSDGLKGTIYEVCLPDDIFLINETIEQSYDKIKHLLINPSQFLFYGNYDKKMVPIVQEIIKDELGISSELDWRSKKGEILPMLKNFEYFHGKAHHQFDDIYNGLRDLTESPLTLLCKEFYADFAEKDSVVDYIKSLDDKELRENLAAYIAVHFDGMFMPIGITKDIRHAIEIPYLYYALKKKDTKKILVEVQELVNNRIIYMPLQEIFVDKKEVKNDFKSIPVLKKLLKQQEDSILKYIKEVRNTFCS